MGKYFKELLILDCCLLLAWSVNPTLNEHEFLGVLLVMVIVVQLICWWLFKDDQNP